MADIFKACTNFHNAINDWNFAVIRLFVSRNSIQSTQEIYNISELHGKDKLNISYIESVCFSHSTVYFYYD